MDAGETLLILRLLLALLLYGFLGFAMVTLWRDLRREAAPTSPQPTSALLHWRNSAGDDVSLVLEPITALGRAEDNSLPLNDAFASAYHALVLWREGQWYIEDLGSHNGTHVNGDRISHSCVLVHGDEIRIGETLLRFELKSPTD